MNSQTAPPPVNSQTAPPPQTLQPPTQPGEWSLQQIQDALKRPLPPNLLSRIKERGNAQYLPWYRTIQILDKYCLGWSWEIRHLQLSSDRLFLIGRLSVPTRDGLVYREATGTEELAPRSLQQIHRTTGSQRTGLWRSIF